MKNVFTNNSSVHGNDMQWASDTIVSSLCKSRDLKNKNGKTVELEHNTDCDATVGITTPHHSINLPLF